MPFAAMDMLKCCTTLSCWTRWLPSVVVTKPALLWVVTNMKYTRLLGFFFLQPTQRICDCDLTSKFSSLWASCCVFSCDGKVFRLVWSVRVLFLSFLSDYLAKDMS